VDFGKEKPGVGAQEAKFVAGVGMRERIRQFGGACEIISMETATAVIARIL
jgi:signal transduction histidine kinase